MKIPRTRKPKIRNLILRKKANDSYSSCRIFPERRLMIGINRFLGYASCSVATDMQPWKSLTWWLVDIYIFTVLVLSPPPLLFSAILRLNGRATFPYSPPPGLTGRAAELSTDYPSFKNAGATRHLNPYRDTPSRYCFWFRIWLE